MNQWLPPQPIPEGNPFVIPVDHFRSWQGLPRRWRGLDSIPESLECAGIICTDEAAMKLCVLCISHRSALFHAQFFDGSTLPYWGKITQFSCCAMLRLDGTHAGQMVAFTLLRGAK